MKHTSKSLMMTGAATALVLSSIAASAETIRFWTTEEQPLGASGTNGCGFRRSVGPRSRSDPGY